MTAAPPTFRPTFTANRSNARQLTERIPVAGGGTDNEPPRLSLSITQVLASMGAAVVAALIGSRLGVAGTLIGAALASVISVVGSAVFGHSILMTHKQVRKAVLQVRGPEERTHPSAAAHPAHHLADDPTVLIPAVSRFDLERAARVGPPGLDRSEPGRRRPIRRRVGAAVLVGVAATAAIFASSLGAVTLAETIKGSPLSGGDSGGLSVLGGNGSGTTDPGQVPATTTAHVSQVSTVTQTVTSPPASSESATSAAPTASSASPTSASASASTSAPSTRTSGAQTSAQSASASASASAGAANTSAGATSVPSSPAVVGAVGG